MAFSPVACFSGSCAVLIEPSYASVALVSIHSEYLPKSKSIIVKSNIEIQERFFHLIKNCLSFLAWFSVSAGLSGVSGDFACEAVEISVGLSA